MFSGKTLIIEKETISFECFIFFTRKVSNIASVKKEVEHEYYDRDEFPLIGFIVWIFIAYCAWNIFKEGGSWVFFEEIYSSFPSFDLIKNTVEFSTKHKSLFFLFYLLSIYSVLSMFLKYFFSSKKYTFKEDVSVLRISFSDGKIIEFSGSDSFIKESLHMIKDFFNESKEIKLVIDFKNENSFFI